MHGTEGYLAGSLLIAMPSMGDTRFEQTVVYVCAHSDEGAMGLIINRSMENVAFSDVVEQLDIEGSGAVPDIEVHAGGPVETGRGFVLHTTDYQHESTMPVADGIALTASIEILKAMVEGRGPRRSLLALGYAGWNAGQLDQELRDNAWLVAPADPDLIFSSALETKWQRALGKLGVDVSMLSGAAGHA